MPSTYQVTVPTVQRALRNLRHVLQAGERHAHETGIAPDTLLQSRLIEDMLPLLRNVQIATDTAKNSIARLAAVEAPKFEDDETSFAQLYARIDRAIEYIGTVAPDAFDASEARAITMTTGSRGDVRFEGAAAYLSDFMLPNFFFHCTTCYAILRQAGVPLGKKDYLWPN
ncbi:DUF1993 domain-containing protein [Lysobacter panacisoli]|uniref:DUF1993 domain-containing protein n=1 Tax=Lysobacter panacisoli TaxID=1255263 RepID=A0ABP9L6H7_9GAMM|nr:DUF1993 domain-containing protein [Lysobacter panacisoli]